MSEQAVLGALRFVSPPEVETMQFDWGTIKWLAESRITGSGIAVGLVILEPGKGHLRHNHPGSEEVLYYVSGEGRQMVEDDDGNPMYRDVRAGAFMNPLASGRAYELIGQVALGLKVSLS